MSDSTTTSVEFTTQLEARLKEARAIVNQLSTIARDVSRIIAKAELQLVEFRQTTLPLDAPPKRAKKKPAKKRSKR